MDPAEILKLLREIVIVNEEVLKALTTMGQPYLIYEGDRGNHDMG